MRRTILLLSLPILAVGGFYVVLSHLAKPPAPPPEAAKTVASKPAEPDTSIHYPIATKAEPSSAAGQAALPSLHDSDGVVFDALAALLKNQSFIDLINRDGIVRRIVATIDNLPRETIAAQLRPLKPVAGKFQTATENGVLVIAASNAQRYEPYISVMQTIDARSLVSLYVRFYPLFQQAYEDLGYPKAYFNDRLIAVIDHLLACPEAPATIRLAQPHVDFTFADPDMEHMSAGDKILFRIGEANEDKVKHKLREIRDELISRSNSTL